MGPKHKYDAPSRRHRCVLWTAVACFVALACLSKPAKRFAPAPRALEYCEAPPVAEEGGAVRAVVVVVRHGARSGIHVDEPGTGRSDWDCSLDGRLERLIPPSLWPAIAGGYCQRGQLVARGFHQHLALGAALGERYGPRNWTVSARSTPYQRTRASAAAFLAGFGVAGDVAHRNDASKEPMFGVEGEDGRGMPCPRGAAAAERQRAAWRLPDEAAEVRAALPALPKDFSPTHVADEAYSRACEQGRDLCVGGRCLGPAAGALLKLADRFYARRYAGADGGWEAARLGMYPMLDEVRRFLMETLADHDTLRDRAGPPRLRLYAGHDTVIAPLLSALGAFDGKWPPLASRVVFELYGLTYEGATVRVLFNGRDVSQKACGRSAKPERGCPMARFEAAVDELLGGAHDWDAACRMPRPPAA